MNPPLAPSVIQPAHLWVPQRRGSYGPEIVDFCDMIGLPLDDEQRQAIDVLASYGPGGRWLTLEVAIIEGRQNGKTMKVVLPIVLADLFLFDDPDRMIWTSHLMRTTRDAFDEVKRLIDGSDYLSARVADIVEAKSEEAIELTSGASLEFHARTKTGGRGLGGKRLVFDEALFLIAEPMGSLIPTLSARSATGSPQIMYASSAGKAESDHLRRLRDRGRRGGDPSLIYIEYCAPGGWDNPGCELGAKCTHDVGVGGCVLDNEMLWPLGNHAIPRRISYEFVRGERRTLPVREFGRERLGWWDEPSAQWSVIPKQVWADLADPASEASGAVAFAAVIDPERTMGAIGVAGRREDGLDHVEVVDHRLGTGWMVDRIVELAGKWENCGFAVDVGGQAGSLIAPLVEAGFQVIAPTADPAAGGLALVRPFVRETAQAFGGFFEAVMDTRRLRHLGQLEVDAALGAASTRRVGNAKAWDDAGDVSICPLRAITLARWLFATRGHLVPPNPPPQIF